mmetsp:Transcript_54134/g.152141  ORF Transcript_54134/g.152141 Transcript_54134/m.152141 type:complete len:303 (-) Transcript_54134:378-1286(-)
MAERGRAAAPVGQARELGDGQDVRVPLHLGHRDQRRLLMVRHELRGVAHRRRTVVGHHQHRAVLRVLLHSRVGAQADRIPPGLLLQLRDVLEHLRHGSGGLLPVGHDDLALRLARCLRRKHHLRARAPHREDGKVAARAQGHQVRGRAPPDLELARRFHLRAILEHHHVDLGVLRLRAHLRAGRLNAPDLRKGHDDEGGGRDDPPVVRLRGGCDDGPVHGGQRRRGLERPLASHLTLGHTVQGPVRPFHCLQPDRVPERPHRDLREPGAGARPARPRDTGSGAPAEPARGERRVGGDVREVR